MTIPRKDRPKATLDNVNDFLNQLGPKFKNINFKVSVKRKGLEIYLKHPGTIG